MKSRYILMLLLVFVSCNSYDYRITKLNNSTVTYSELPPEIKKMFTSRNDYECVAPEGYNNKFHCTMYCLDESKDYEIQVIHPRFGPKSWISYEVLTDKKRQISYRVETDMANPYIIFENKLYVANKYNFFSGNTQDSTKLKDLSFTCYELK